MGNVPTLEEIVATYRKAHDESCMDGGEDHEAERMRAVLETHFVPMWAAAYRQGERSAEGAEECEVHAASEKEADRIIRQILGPAAPQDEKG